MGTHTQIEFQKERRQQLIEHIAFLYSTRRNVAAQIEIAEKEIEVIERFIAMLQNRTVEA